jgi:hypothetical protein
MRIHRVPFWLLFIAMTSYGCSSSLNTVGTGNTEEMKRIQEAFGDLQKGLDTGVSKQEFTQRVNDTLAKIGDLEKSEAMTDAGLPKATVKVAVVYGYFGQAAAAYTLSPQFIGDRWDDQSERTTDSTSDAEQQSLKAAFPEFYAADNLSRRTTLHNLLQIAQGNTHDASEMIGTL